jgi:hypothetical protein
MNRFESARNTLDTDTLKSGARRSSHLCYMAIRMDFTISIAKLAPTRPTHPIRVGQYYFFGRVERLWRDIVFFVGEIRDQFLQVRAISTADQSQ